MKTVKDSIQEATALSLLVWASKLLTQRAMFRQVVYFIDSKGSLRKREDRIDMEAYLKGVSQSNNIGMDHSLQNLALCPYIVAVLLLQYFLLPHHFHCVNLSCVLLPHLEDLQADGQFLGVNLINFPWE